MNGWRRDELSHRSGSYTEQLLSVSSGRFTEPHVKAPGSLTNIMRSLTHASEVGHGFVQDSPEVAKLYRPSNAASSRSVRQGWFQPRVLQQTVERLSKLLVGF